MTANLPKVADMKTKISRAEQNAALREKAARQASKVMGEKVEIPNVQCRVTHKGDAKVSTGEHVGGVGEVHYEKGEIFTAPLPIAEELQERGYVEIQ